MRKLITASSVLALATAGMVYAASGGTGSSGLESYVTLPGASPAASASPAAINPTPAATDSTLSDAQADAAMIADSYICVFKDSIGRGSVQAEAARAAHNAGGSLTHVYRYAIKGFSLHAKGSAVSAMKVRNPAIAYCEGDKIASIIDPISAQKPGGGGGRPGPSPSPSPSPTPSPSQTTPAGIARVGGALSTVAGRAWIIDTGIQSDHPDLNVDQNLGMNFVPRETSWEDLNGHGTHVSGTIGAVNNGIGVIGVDPGVDLIAVRVLNKRGSGAYSTVIAGIDYVAQYVTDHGTANDVANMSLGGPADDTLDAAVRGAATAGVKFAIAAGNSAADANKYSPARAGDGRMIFTISAIDSTDTFAYFSNWGNPPISFAEPGVNILSTWIGSGYNTISGTSMASPHAAGLLLLGAIRSDGTAKADPDGNPDPIGHS